MPKFFFLKNLIKRFEVIFPYLIGVYPLLFLFNYNKEELYLYELLMPILVILCSIKLLMLIFFRIFNDAKRAGLFLLALLIIFFFYDNIFDFLVPYRDWTILTDLNQFLILFFIISCLLFFIFLRKSDIKPEIIKFLNIIGVTLIVFNLFEVSIYKIFNNIQLADKGKIDLTSQIKSSKNQEDLRDIYFIILDSYPSSKVLMEYYDYDNNHFIESLKSKGFYIANNSMANYPSASFLSIASTLNMEYINYIGESIDDLNNFKDRKIPYEMIKKNKLISILASYGYKYIHFKSTWGATDHNPNADVNLGGPHSIMLSQLSTEFNMIIAKSTILREWFKNNNYFGLTRDQILFNLNKISDLDAISDPKFVFAHIFSPHPPYVFDEDGQNPDLVDMNYSGNVWGLKDAFINQLKFVNKKIIFAVDKILNNSAIEPIIIIQGDHGTCSTCGSENLNSSDMGGVTEEALRERLNILNAMYMPDGGDEILYSNISTVNTFRCVLNFYFEEKINLLKDKNYYSYQNSPYKFFDITGRGIYK